MNNSKINDMKNMNSNDVCRKKSVNIVENDNFITILGQNLDATKNILPEERDFHLLEIERENYNFLAAQNRNENKKINNDINKINENEKKMRKKCDVGNIPAMCKYEINKLNDNKDEKENKNKERRISYSRIGLVAEEDSAYEERYGNVLLEVNILEKRKKKSYEIDDTKNYFFDYDRNKKKEIVNMKNENGNNDVEINDNISCNNHNNNNSNNNNNDNGTNDNNNHNSHNDNNNDADDNINETTTIHNCNSTPLNELFYRSSMLDDAERRLGFNDENRFYRFQEFRRLRHNDNNIKLYNSKNGFNTKKLLYGGIFSDKKDYLRRYNRKKSKRLIIDKKNYHRVEKAEKIKINRNRESCRDGNAVGIEEEKEVEKNIHKVEVAGDDDNNSDFDQNVKDGDDEIGRASCRERVLYTV